VSAPGPTAALDAHLDRLVGLLLTPGAAGLRQVAFTVVCTVSWALVALPALPAADATPGPAVTWPAMWLSLVLVLGAQAAGLLLPWARLAPGWQTVLPLVQLAALAALQHGSATAVTAVDAVLLLPVVTLGLQGTWSAVVIATVGAAGVAAVPPGALEPLVPRVVVVPLVAFLVALGTAVAVRRLLAPSPGATDRTDATGEAERRAQRQEELIGTVDHDLRSPLTSVLGYAQLLRADRLTDEQHAYVDVIDRNGRRLLHLVEELVLGAQLAPGRPGPARRDVDLAQVARACGDELGPTAQAAGVTLTVTAPGPVPVSGEPELLAQMITSLLGGAIKATPRDGTVTVKLRADPRDQPDTADGSHDGRTPDAVLEVVDTGPGMGPDELSRLTERLYRARDTPDGEVVLGLGLGLPVVQAVVDAHDGTLSVDSAPGAGTTVTVTLPTA
jgi:signal transduction histidine kinase